MTSRQLDVVNRSDAPGPQVRHPGDGWELALPLEVSAGTKRVIVALADAILPPEPRTDTIVTDVVDNFLVMMRYLPKASRLGFLAGMHLLNFSPLWRLRDVRPLTALPTERARSVLRGIMASSFLPIRLLMLGPQALLLSGFFDDDSVHPHLDYDPKPFARDRILLRQRLLRGETPQPDDSINPPKDTRPRP